MDDYIELSARRSPLFTLRQLGLLAAVASGLAYAVVPLLH